VVGNTAVPRHPRGLCSFARRRLFGFAVNRQAIAAGRPEDRVIVRLLQAGNVCFARIYHRLSVVSPMRLPREGAGILICNHISGLDPLMIQSACPRLIVWMMASEYYEVRGLNRIFRTVGAIPVERSGRDMAATRAAMRAIDDGRIVGIFPEGRIEPSRQLLPFQTGVAMMALRKGVPIYPAHLEGTQRGKPMLEAMLKPRVASLAFGEPLHLKETDSSREGLERATRQLEQAVASLSRLNR
jgi:1-acyl-sn-glycerol-3-phosphate acyltransferase